MNQDQSEKNALDAVLANPNLRDRVIELFRYISGEPPSAPLPTKTIIKVVDDLIDHTKLVMLDELTDLLEDKSKKISAPKRIIVQSGVTCPSHTAQQGSDKTGLDSWEQRGPDRCCSYCGSFHPEDFLAFLKQAIDPESTVRIERADNKSKWYVYRPEVPTSKEGGLKFYGFHGGDMTDKLNDALPEATRVSREKFDKDFRRRKAEHYPNP